MVAIANTSVTFRSQPTQCGDNVGGVYGNQAVKVIARNITATWFYIIAPEVPGGMAWVLAAGFTLQGDITQLPIGVIPKGQKTPVLYPPVIYTIPGGVALPLNSPAPGAITATLNQLARVRVGPGLGYMEMGLLDAGTTVVLTGHIKGNAWLQIEYPSGLDGRGWISKELVKFQGDYSVLTLYNQLSTPVTGEEEEAPAAPASTDIPVTDATPVDTPIPPTPELPYGITLAQINVRSGPASSYSAYGLIDKDQRVNILGQTLSGLWLQIEYPSAPTGVAWVSSQYVKLMSDISTLPYFDNDGNPLPKP